MERQFFQIKVENSTLKTKVAEQQSRINRLERKILKAQTLLQTRSSDEEQSSSEDESKVEKIREVDNLPLDNNMFVSQKIKEKVDELATKLEALQKGKLGKMKELLGIAQKLRATVAVPPDMFQTGKRDLKVNERGSIVLKAKRRRKIEALTEAQDDTELPSNGLRVQIPGLQCSECQGFFVTEEKLENHRKTKHGNVANNTGKVVVEPELHDVIKKPTELGHFCLCGESFSKRTSLYFHISQHNAMGGKVA